MSFRDDLQATQARLRALEEEVEALRSSGDRAAELERRLAELEAELRQARRREQELSAEIRRSADLDRAASPKGTSYEGGYLAELGRTSRGCVQLFVVVMIVIVVATAWKQCAPRQTVRAAPRVEDAATVARMDETRTRLRVLSEAMHACEGVSAEVAAIDALLDPAPDSARGLQLLGEALQLATEACPSDPPRARHAASAEDAFAEAKRRAGGGSGAAAGGCAPGQALAEGRELAAASRWANAAEAYRRELYGGCTAGIHWRGTILGLHGAARLGLARAAIHLGDDFEARRQLRLLDLERMEAALHIGDETEEARLWEKLGPSPPLDHAKQPRSPEEAVRWLERAAVADDAGAFLAALAQSAPDRPLLAGRRVDERPCDLRVDDAPVRLRMCILINLLPEAPRAVACERTSPGRATCRVTGAAGDVRVVALVAEDGAFRVLSSERP